MKTKKIEQVTVMQMYLCLQKAILEGNGGKYLVVSDDNEGNGYHGCFYGISQLEDDAIDLVNDSQILNPKQLMIIG